MKPLTYLFFTVGLWLTFACGNKQPASTTNPATTTPAGKEALASWRDGPLKQAIIAYVEKVTKDGSPDYIPPADRIATFDNDGTLWAERPYVQELFAIYQVKKMVAANPALANKQPFKAAVEHDKAWFEKGGEKALVEMVGATHTGMTEDAFEAAAGSFFENAQYPVLNKPVKEIVYQPQLELLQYLRDNGFKTFICTGGTIEFVRAIAPAYYGIPKEQVIGTSFKYQFVDSNRTILRTPVLEHFNDKEGKPPGIQLHIGQRPVFACGNEGGAGDIAMLKYCQSSRYPSFQLLINHDDGDREFAYQEKDSASLKAAAQNKWHVVSMKDDWINIFPTPSATQKK
ncbi:HAD family hydrolase [Paraflavitalea sp. CAU 1676]|uniref:HAD family hydrolase n=1 Tax=Paraflavitalea sp. CAU 1676 TaxID=3032598 RepID=UPI0023DBB8EC|nr:HAD family hydrolase [Paraflavitalea sp. CAU 1676]MDF2191587.1 HAD family hydrolase [Paraflavitalea sp. CAU 1676]